MYKVIFKKFNRFKNHRMPKLGKFWCPMCDRFLMGIGEKCKICGYKEKRRDK